MIIVYTYIVLDVIHEGHLLYLRNAKAIAGVDGRLIVGVLTDEAVMEKKERPIMPFRERLKIAESIKFIDLVVPQETYSPLPNVRGIKPNVLQESSSHDRKMINEARKCMAELGGRLIVTPYFPFQSSSRIKEKINEGQS